MLQHLLAVTPVSQSLSHQWFQISLAVSVEMLAIVSNCEPCESLLANVTPSRYFEVLLGNLVDVGTHWYFKVLQGTLRCFRYPEVLLGTLRFF